MQIQISKKHNRSISIKDHHNIMLKELLAALNAEWKNRKHYKGTEKWHHLVNTNELFILQRTKKATYKHKRTKRIRMKRLKTEITQGRTKVTIFSSRTQLKGNKLNTFHKKKGKKKKNLVYTCNESTDRVGGGGVFFVCVEHILFDLGRQLLWHSEVNTSCLNLQYNYLGNLK